MSQSTVISSSYPVFVILLLKNPKTEKKIEIEIYSLTIFYKFVQVQAWHF